MSFSDLGKNVDNEIKQATPFMKYFVIGLVSILLLTISFCSLKGCNSPTIITSPQQTHEPIIVPQQQQVHHVENNGLNNAATGAIVGGAAGYMLGKNSVKKQYVQPIYIRPVRKVYAPRRSFSSYKYSSRR